MLKCYMNFIHNIVIQIFLLILHQAEKLKILQIVSLKVHLNKNKLHKCIYVSQVRSGDLLLVVIPSSTTYQHGRDAGDQTGNPTLFG